MTEETLAKALDHLGLELRIWKEDYFGYKSEEDLIKRLANELTALKVN